MASRSSNGSRRKGKEPDMEEDGLEIGRVEW